MNISALKWMLFYTKGLHSMPTQEKKGHEPLYKCTEATRKSLRESCTKHTQPYTTTVDNKLIVIVCARELLLLSRAKAKKSGEKLKNKIRKGRKYVLGVLITLMEHSRQGGPSSEPCC